MADSVYASTRSSHDCIATGRGLTAGEPCVVLLCERDDAPGQLERVMMCAQAWDDGSRHPAPERVVGHWRTTVPDGTKKKASLLDASSSVDLLMQLGESDDTQRIEFRSVLALLLVRSRVLELLKADRDHIVVRRPYTVAQRDAGEPEPEHIRVEQPKMGDEEIARVAEQLEAIMDAGDS